MRGYIDGWVWRLRRWEILDDLVFGCWCIQEVSLFAGNVLMDDLYIVPIPYSRFPSSYLQINSFVKRRRYPPYSLFFWKQITESFVINYTIIPVCSPHSTLSSDFKTQVPNSSE